LRCVAVRDRDIRLVRLEIGSTRYLGLVLPDVRSIGGEALARKLRLARLHGPKIIRPGSRASPFTDVAG
jgi:hypothetical protein